MEKYLIIIIIIITLYYIQKYCIKSEVQKFLITKNIIENFTTSTTVNFDDQAVNFDDQAAFNTLYDIESDLFKNNNLNILGNIIINNKHKLISDGDTLKITDLSNQNFLNLVVKDMDINGILTVKGPYSFNNALFVNSTNSKQLSITGSNISSINSDLLLSSNTNNITLGNTNISGNLSFNNNKKPIISKIIIINKNSRDIDTLVNYEEYSGISFSGYDHSTNRINGNNLQVNTIRNPDTKTWIISFNQVLSNLETGINIRMKFIFFHTNFVQDCYENNIPTIYQPYCSL
jgi:hypothetical protein